MFQFKFRSVCGRVTVISLSFSFVFLRRVNAQRAHRTAAIVAENGALMRAGWSRSLIDVCQCQIAPASNHHPLLSPPKAHLNVDELLIFPADLLLINFQLLSKKIKNFMKKKKICWDWGSNPGPP